MNHFISKEDLEDYEQEKEIQKWSSSAGRSINFESDLFKYTNRKGSARNFRVRASISLDQKISEDGSGTFADIIAGSDGRDPDNRECFRDPNEEMIFTLMCIGFKWGESKWLVKTMEKYLNQDSLHYEMLDKDLE